MRLIELLVPVTGALALVAILLAARLVRRLQAEKQRVASESAFQASLLAQVNTAVVATDLDHRITCWNPAAELLFGWSAREVIGTGSPELGLLAIPPELAAEIVARLEADGAWDGEIDTRRSDGTPVPVYCTIGVLRDAGGAAIGHVAVMNDIRARRAAEESLRRSEAKYRELVETSHDLIWAVDADGRLSFVNRDAASRMLGFAPEDVEGRRFSEVIPIDSVQGDPAAFRRARAGEPRFQFEIAYHRRDATLVHLDVKGVTVCDEAGRLVRSSGTAADVTERKQKEAERVHYTRQLQEIARTAVLVTSELSSEAVLRIVADRARAIIGARRAFAGAYREGSSDLTLFAVAPPAADDGREGMREFVARGAPSLPAAGGRSTLVSAITRRDGSAMGSIVVEEKIAGDFTQSDQSILAQLASLASVAIVNAELFDETHRASARLEERVAERTRELREINDSLETFAYTISHDLRAPLNAVKGFADVLVDEVWDRLDPSGQRHLELIVAAAGRMEKMIADLLEFCRMGGDELAVEPVDLTAVVRTAILQTEPVLRRQRARITVTGPSLIVRGNPPTLTQAVANLLSNAVKFVAPKTIPRVRVELEARGDVARLWVRDNGIGVADEDRERIFEPFERLHSRDAYPGTGLGLAIVRRALARMAGRVGVDSSPGEGSEFWMELPLAAPAAAALSDRGSGGGGRSGKRPADRADRGSRGSRPSAGRGERAPGP